MPLEYLGELRQRRSQPLQEEMGSLEGDHGKIKLTKGREAIVDKNMIDVISNYNWQSSVAKKRIYARTFFDGRGVYMHHVVIGKPLRGMQVDHINGNPLDNRIKNLRIVSCRENQSNRLVHINGKTLGIYSRDGHFAVQICIEGKNRWVGTFKTLTEAISSRKKYLKNWQSYKAGVGK